MKGLALFGLALCLVTSLAFAREATTTTTAAPVVAATIPVTAETTLNGTIIDNLCASSQKPEALADFIKTHTKQCALMSACAASGYSIYVDGALIKFDQASNAKVEAFLKQTDSKLEVTVTVKQVGKELSLVSITNQK